MDQPIIRLAPSNFHEWYHNRYPTPDTIQRLIDCTTVDWTTKPLADLKFRVSNIVMGYGSDSFFRYLKAHNEKLRLESVLTADEDDVLQAAIRKHEETLAIAHRLISQSLGKTTDPEDLAAKLRTLLKAYDIQEIHLERLCVITYGGVQATDLLISCAREFPPAPKIDLDDPTES